MNNPLVSIIVVNWNGQKWLDKFTSSLKKQTYTNFELVFVDNNSSDESVNYVLNNFPNVNLIKNQQNLGFASGNNIGISKAKGDLILLINNDTWIEEAFLEEIVHFYINHEYDVVAPLEADYYTNVKRSFYSSKIDLLGYQMYQKSNSKRINDSFYLTGVCLLFSKDLYISTDGLDNNFFMYCEEVDWFWRLILLRKKFTYIDDLYIYHASAGTRKQSVDRNVFLWRNENTLQMLLKNYEWYTLLLILPLYILQNIIEIIFFLFYKPSISHTYIQGWVFNLKHFSSIVAKRKKIQKLRLVNDIEILKRMFLGNAKVKHLVRSYKKYENE